MKKLIKRKSRTKSRQVPSKGLGERVAKATETLTRKDLPQFRSGDTVRVHVRIIEGDKERVQLFDGVCIQRRKAGVGSSFVVRKMSHGVGVEKIFLECSPKVAKVELVTPGMVRRSRLYYLRDLRGRAAKIDQDQDMSRKAVPAEA